jgi:pimeloyl-ACP methyl ester carboxylesterase
MASRTPLRAAGAVVLGAGMAAIAGLAAASVAGNRVRKRSDPTIDALIPDPPGITHHQLATRDGGSLHVAERGSGPPVVLLHGVTLQWSVWSAQFHTLADRHRVLAWDMRGHGRSRAGSEGVTLEAVAHDLATLLQDLEVHDAIVVGHSMGGMALARFCTDHHTLLHHRCRGLMFLATSAAPVALPALVGGGAGLTELAQRVATAGMKAPRLRYGWPDNAATALVIRTAFGRRVSGAAVEQVRRMIAEVDPVTAVEAGRAIAEHDVRHNLGHVAVPSLVVVGDADLLTPPSHAEAVVEAVPGAQLRILPGVGHQVMQEAPEELAALIEELETLAVERGRRLVSPATD